MSKYALQDTNTGFYFVLNAGFIASVLAEATPLTSAELSNKSACALSMGINTTSVAIPEVVSYAVVYIRKGEGENLLKGYGKNAPDANNGQVDPSQRRFATFDEAVQHGSRFDTRRKERGDKPGTAGHEGFFVITTNDPVNAKVNWKTGLTNSI